MTLTTEAIYNRIIGIRDNLILDTENPTKEQIDKARQEAALKLEGLAEEIREETYRKC